MTRSFQLTEPVVILGTPRSGTSMLQRLIRCQPGFMSLAMESNTVWDRYTHPELNGWEREGWPGGSLEPSEVSRIHRALLRRAVTSGVWRRVDARKIGERRHERPLLATIAAPSYRLAALGSWLSGANHRARLVEKSVHSSLRLELIETVFPDAVYVHIVRNPLENLRSMIHAWLDPDRFFTYDLPKAVQAEGYPFAKWNLPLPPGWRQHINQPLEQLVAFQWASLQESLVAFGDRHADRTIRLKLEELVHQPRDGLRRLAHHLDLAWNEQLEEFARGIPRVNARSGSPDDQQAIGPVATDRLVNALEPYSKLARAIGY